MRSRGAIIGLVWLVLAGVPSAWAGRIVTVGYSAPAGLQGLHVVEHVAPLRVAEVSTSNISLLRRRPGIRWVHGTVARRHLGEPALVAPAGTALAEWQYAATREDLVPATVQRAAASITIAVVDTGADLTAPAIAAKGPVAYNVITGDSTVSDPIGHGTFVASLAGGSVSNSDGLAGFGGDVHVMIIQANRDANTFTDVDEAAGIVGAVDHGAQIVNLSIGGTQASQVEHDADRLRDRPQRPARGRCRKQRCGREPAVLSRRAALQPRSRSRRVDRSRPSRVVLDRCAAAPQVAGAAALVWAADSISTPPRPLRWQAGCPHPRRFECPSRRPRRFHATL